ncbi:PRONE domain-containing protein [Artemisia annua]|uniref:PRONE domain-containing protein n=1 Tax=Artemisia annua TaxID=35608 RepID=A0A2U1KXA1_ARTAN|nr:PRONE domain-containing protein [Artemisia annua]
MIASHQKCDYKPGKKLDLAANPAHESVDNNYQVMRTLEAMVVISQSEAAAAHSQPTSSRRHHTGQHQRRATDSHPDVPVDPPSVVHCRVPIGGLSNGERKKLIKEVALVHQVFKAAKSMNQTILLEMPIPKIIGEALPKSLKDGENFVEDGVLGHIDVLCHGMASL